MAFGECVTEPGSRTPDTDARTRVSILTGFLGSGKTTLLNHLLRSSRGLRVAVIENEYGEVGVDDALVNIETEEEVFEMNNGVVCCTVRGYLIRILYKLASRRPPLDYVLIETTGLADPAPVAQTFFVDAQIKRHYDLDAILTVVDARHVLAHIVDHQRPEGAENECQEQIGFADKILLNKVDLVTDAERRMVMERVREINRFAQIFETEHAVVDATAVLGIRAFDLSAVLRREEDFLDTTVEHVHDDSIISVGFALPGAFNLVRLNARLATLLRERGADIFRSKGVLHVAGSDARFVFQGVHMLMSLASSEAGFGRPWEEGEPRISRIVFIGRGLDRSELKEKFLACMVEHA
uniref:CobW C-terminal domain-containing protein n=1 Tax=Corethron hystrix TaxID=216773 RepID=A0A7S1G1M6_9STRA